MELSSQMLLFAQVVESGSFSAAARRVEHTHSAVSKQIAQLEDRLGVRLLNRTQSGISLTEAGAVFYEKCAEVAARVAEAEATVQTLTGEARGLLRVASTVAFAKSQVMPLLAEFLMRHPKVRITLELTDRDVDLGAGAVDVAIQFTEQVHGATVVARKLASNRRILVAAPSYLANFGLIDRPEDVGRANCLRLSTVARWNDWGLVGADGAPAPVDGNFEATSADRRRPPVEVSGERRSAQRPAGARAAGLRERRQRHLRPLRRPSQPAAPHPRLRRLPRRALRARPAVGAVISPRT
jgi:DNA-binding transcriptional LysR family regulator